MDVKNLQISIITKNNPTKLFKCLERILPQLDDDCLLLIFDDGNNVDIEPILEKTTNKTNIKLIRQKKPIGFDAASLRIIEYSKCEWIWTIRDIDLPSPTAIKQIKSLIASSREKVGIVKFGSNENFILGKSNIHKIIADENFSTKLSLAATSIYYRPSILTLQPAYRAISSHACHAILALEHLKNDGNIEFNAHDLFESIGEVFDNQLEFHANFYKANIFLDPHLKKSDPDILKNIFSFHDKLEANMAFREAYRLEKKKGYNYTLFIYTEFVWGAILQNKKLNQIILNLVYYFLWRLHLKFILVTSKSRRE